MRPTPFRALILLLPVLAFVAAAQEPSPPDASRLLSCAIDGHAPDAPGRADEGGYLFEFQSLRGTTDDDRACTVYRLRNTPGKAPTPFRWTLGDEVIVDKARLARCDDGREGCPWLAFAKYFPGEIDANLSSISYGLNADAYRRQAETFMTSVSVRDAEVAEAQELLASSVGTELAGTFSDEAGRAYDLHLLVKSRFEPDPDGNRLLIYEVDDLSGSGALGSGAIRVAWGALDEVDAVRSVLDGSGDASLGAVDRGANHLYVTIRASAFVLDESFAFHAYARGDDEPLATVAMPAFVPAP